MRQRNTLATLCMTLLISFGAVVAWLSIESVSPVHVNVAAAPNDDRPPKRDAWRPPENFSIPAPRIVEPRRGTLRGFITGRTLYASGRPCRRVKVLAGAVHIDRFPSQRGREKEFPFLADASFLQSTESDDDGNYTLTFMFTVEAGVDSVPLHIWTEMPGESTSAPEMVRVFAATDLWDVDLKVVPPSRIKGRIKFEPNVFPDGVWVRCVNEGARRTQFARTGLDGAFTFTELRTGFYTIEVQEQALATVTLGPDTTYDIGLLELRGR
jgi:hypothetical protein